MRDLLALVLLGCCWVASPARAQRPPAEYLEALRIAARVQPLPSLAALGYEWFPDTVHVGSAPRAAPAVRLGALLTQLRGWFELAREAGERTSRIRDPRLRNDARRALVEALVDFEDRVLAPSLGGTVMQAPPGLQDAARASLCELAVLALVESPAHSSWVRPALLDRYGRDAVREVLAAHAPELVAVWEQIAPGLAHVAGAALPAPRDCDFAPRLAGL